MTYKTTEAQEEFRIKVREFAEEKIKPVAFHLDETATFPEEIIKEMGELGLMGIPFEKEYGGAGLSNIEYAIAVEELSRVDGGVGVILSAHTSLGSWPIYNFGTEEQKKKYLVPLAKGEKIGAFGLTEDNAGSDAGKTETTAVLKDDYYILNGKKIFITNAPKADTYVVMAVTTPGKGIHGISAFIVEKDFEGFTFSEPYNKLGIRSSVTAELYFKNVKVPKENLLGKEGEGFKVAMATLDGGRIGIASQALGISQGAFESALKYAKQREQFGTPIAFLQANQFKLADMATNIRAARLMVYSAAELKNEHIKTYGKEAAMAKQFASDLAEKITSEAIQIYGGSGFIKGTDVERFYRDSKITQIYEGTNEIMRVVVGSYVVGKPPKKEKKFTPKKRMPMTGDRKNVILKGNPKEAAKELVKALKADGYTFDLKADIDQPIGEAERVIAAGMGIGEEINMGLVKSLAEKTGAALGGSRPIAEVKKYIPLDKYIGVSGQKFKGSLYFAIGISGAVQHLIGIKTAKTIVAINNSESARIFENADYGIVGDFRDVIPAILEELEK